MTATETERLEEALGRLAENRRDEAAWSTVISLTYPITLATANRTLRGTLDLAKDAASESFARIARYANFHILDLKTAPAFIRYLKQVTRRTSFEILKRLARHAPEVQLDQNLLEEIAASNDETPEDELAAQELHAAIRGVLEPDELVLLELMVNGASLNAMAQKFGISYGALSLRRHRLRAKVRRYLASRS